MSAINGLLSLTNGPGTDEWVSEYQETILVRNAKGMNSGSTLFGLMSRLKNEPSETTEFKWFERDPVKREVYSSNARSDSDTTGFTFDDGAAGAVYGIIQPGTVLRNVRTGEHILLGAYTAGGATYAATRAHAGSAAAVLDNDLWVVVTLGKDEGATAAVSVFEAASVSTNYVQTFNSAIELTNAFKGSKLRTDIEGPLRERRVQALERIARDIELAYFLGKATRATGTNGYQYFTGGIKSAVDGLSDSSYILNGNGTAGCTIESFNDWLRSFMTVGSDAKLFLAGPKTYAALSYFANNGSNGFRITQQESVWGMNITAINTPFGEIDMAMHPLFKEISDLQDWGFVVDLAMVVQKVMEPLFLEPNIQTPGQDSYKEQFRAKYGLKLKFPQAFGYCYDLATLV